MAVTAAGTIRMPKNCVNATAAREKARLTQTPVATAAVKAQFSACLAMERARYPRATARPAADQRKLPAGCVMVPEKGAMKTIASVDDVTAQGLRAALPVRKDV